MRRKKHDNINEPHLVGFVPWHLCLMGTDIVRLGLEEIDVDDCQLYLC